MISFINNFNLIIFLVFIVFYAYQFFYVVVGLFHKQKEYTAKKEHKYAVVISARNESSVIGELVRSIKRQKYPQELLDVIVIADNCTDNTAEVSRQAGAIVVERENKELIGKGYALDFLFKKLMNEQPDNGYEGFFVFDADNLLEENYVAEMNKIFDQGYRVVTSYRNSKNYDTNWITAGYS
ncbi:glycosyltransferase family 2 protein, partial [Akkermansia muciniphila]|uniref:glycosyltransferase family 2 protein n=1 Tax=Akkermansia muciniphila TaxID=239935 RepID=UPI00122EC124